ncbi:hypothetical protein [Actinomadura sp. 7K507]|uniref:hypothetical protein n=1 Tax=Actinomadura sp. 7K507 TaxID=2530365 RepID=UPI0010504ED4|nr:hypothetical protein [Actinomadura sp. 7K507]TDC93060.1 hypothetical protein E1285_10540 [Actinomadura sp. 7K507]
MGFDGTKYSDGDFSGITSKLDGASGKVEDGPDAPPEPDAGEVTGEVLSALGLLSGGAAKVAEGLSAMSSAVTDNRRVYITNEDGVTAGVNRAG